MYGTHFAFSFHNQEAYMTTYAVYFYCDKCHQVHPLWVDIDLCNGPLSKACIGDIYAGKDLPPEVAMITEHTTICPIKKVLTFQKDINQVFLEPVLS